MTPFRLQAPGRAGQIAMALAIGLATCMVTAPVLAAEGSTEIEWTTMTMNLFGGLAIFLFGMEQMAEALKAVAGERMKMVLARLTTNRFMGAVTGAFVTAVINSSSVTTVLVVGFISAGLMSMSQSIGVIMGANIGSTVTAQLIAFKVTKAALLMIAVGFGMLFFSKNEKTKHYGGIVMGLGMVFFGMSVMSDAMHPLRNYEPFMELMKRMDNPLVGIAIAAVFTGLIQSSAATTGIVIVMAAQGFISLPAGIALAFGANIGTCATALLASIGKPREAVRAAIVHIIFNILGVVVWFGFIDDLAAFVTWLSPQYPELSGSERVSAEAPRQIANAHTLFNVANTLIFIWFTTQFARLVQWLVPDRPLEEIELVRPKYLDEALLSTPSMALQNVRRELGRAGERAGDMVEQSLPAFLARDRNKMQAVSKIDDEVDALYAAAIGYLGQLSEQKLTQAQTRELTDVMSAANDLESIADLVETDILDLTEECIKKDLHVSDATRKVLIDFHAKVLAAVRQAIQALAEEDQDKARAVTLMKSEVQQLVDALELHEAARLVANAPKRLETYALEIELIENLKRIYYFAKRIAKATVPGELRPKPQ